MKIPSYEIRLDALFNEAFNANDPAILDWAALKFELKFLRKKFSPQQAISPDGDIDADSDDQWDFTHAKEGCTCFVCRARR